MTESQPAPACEPPLPPRRETSPPSTRCSGFPDRSVPGQGEVACERHADDAPASGENSPGAYSGEDGGEPHPDLAAIPSQSIAVGCLTIHPDVEWVPRMPEDQVVEFNADVRANGLEEALLVVPARVPLGEAPTYLVIDGRHRYEAAILRGDTHVSCKVARLSPAQVYDYVFRANVQRRQLVQDQLSILAARWLADHTAEVRKRKASKAGKAGGRGRGKSRDSSGDDPTLKLPPGRVEAEGRDSEGSPHSSGDVSASELPTDGGAEAKSGRALAATKFHTTEYGVRMAQLVLRKAPGVASQVLKRGTGLAEADRELKRRTRGACDTAGPGVPDGAPGQGSGDVVAGVNEAGAGGGPGERSGTARLPQARQHPLGAGGAREPTAAVDAGELRDVIDSLKSAASIVSRNREAIRLLSPGLSAEARVKVDRILGCVEADIRETRSLVRAEEK